MSILPYHTIKIGARFKRVDACAVEVYVKTSDDYTIEHSSGQAIPNAYSDFSAQAFKAQDPVMVLTDEEVVSAKRLEKAAQLGHSIADSVVFDNGKAYIEFTVVKRTIAAIQLDKLW